MHPDRRPRFTLLARQRGQALIYGIFLMLGGLTALFFLFNTGQLVGEKTKLVNTADAVAYSASVMHARALNFDSYTNRAMMANEVTVAQMVSISSWIQYAQGHVNRVTPLNCRVPQYSVPVVHGLVKYFPLCWALSWPIAAPLINNARQVVDAAAPAIMIAGEASKIQMQAAQVTMFAGLLPARKKVMQQVADANYLNDGAIEVDLIPLTDNFTLFDGRPLLRPYMGNDRTRFRDAEVDAADNDEFIAARTWSDRSPWSAICIPPRAFVSHNASTQLINFDEWRANDNASMRIESLRGFIPRCRTIRTYNLGNGARSARSSGSGTWAYSGVPNFFDLSHEARDYRPNHADENKRDLRVRFAIRLTRSNTEAKTSMGRSDIKPEGRFKIYQGNEAKDVMAAVSTSEVFFDRPTPRGDGRRELASTFNPYWQARLIGNSPAVVAAAVALQATGP